MKIKHNILVMIICAAILIYHYIVNYEILSDPYMVGLFITLSGVWLYNFYLAMAKILNDW